MCDIVIIHLSLESVQSASLYISTNFAVWYKWVFFSKEKVLHGTAPLILVLDKLHDHLAILATILHDYCPKSDHCRGSRASHDTIEICLKHTLDDHNLVANSANILHCQPSDDRWPLTSAMGQVQKRYFSWTNFGWPLTMTILLI